MTSPFKKIKRILGNEEYKNILIGGKGIDSDYSKPEEINKCPKLLHEIWGKDVTVCSCGKKHTLGEDVPIKLISAKNMSDTAVDYVVMDDAYKYVLSFECEETEYNPVLEF